MEWGLLLLVIAAGSAAWGVGIVFREFDHDEVQRAHSIWLAAQGLTPYSEFFEVHPPYFVLLAPILRRWTDPCDVLRALRFFSLVGNVAFLGGLVALTRGVAGWQSRWAWLGVAYVAFEPRVLDFLVEFRIDGWGYAVAVWSLVHFLGRVGAGRFVFFGACSGLATLLFCPKLLLLPPLVVSCELIRLWRGPRGALRSAMAYLLGLGITGLLFALFLAANGIALERIYLLLFRYHTLSNAHSAYHNGLLRQVGAAPLLLAPIALGVVAWVIQSIRGRLVRDALHPALSVWLVLQALLVAYHYKQYYAPWFLFGSAFVVVLGRALEGMANPIGRLAFLAAGVTTICSALGIMQLWQGHGRAREQCISLRVMNQIAGRIDRIVAPPPEHPIVRRDVFFLWFNTTDPAGYDSERILGELGPYRDMVSPERNRAALEATPPAFVVLDVGPFAARYPRGQWQALREFLLRRGYRVVRLGGLRLAVRPDRHARLRGWGLIEDAPGPPGPIMPEDR